MPYLSHQTSLYYKISRNFGHGLTTFEDIYDDFQNQLAHVDFALSNAIEGYKVNLKAIER